VASDLNARRKRLLVLGAGSAQLGLLEAARGRDLFVIAADREPAAVGFPLADRRALISAEDEPALERLASAEEVDGIIAPGIDWPVAIAARIAAKLGLSHPISPESAQLATSKLRQRERFAEAGLPQPRYAVATRGEEAEAAAARLGFPVVVKAPDRQRQRGLALARSLEELAPAVELALVASRSGLCLLEELVEGQQVTVAGFSVGGRFRALAVVDRYRGDAQTFGVSPTQVWPSLLGERELEQATRVVAEAARVLGIEEGPTSTEVMMAPDGPRLGELAARLGGDHDAELIEAALGIDLNGLALASALGEPIEPARLEPVERTGAACMHFLVAPPGRLVAVYGVEEALSLEGIERVRIYREPGYVIGSFRTSSDRAGSVLATGSDRDQAIARASRAGALIGFETEPVNGGGEPT
jgi:biotin carboxylase